MQLSTDDAKRRIADLTRGLGERLEEQRRANEAVAIQLALVQEWQSILALLEQVEKPEVSVHPEPDIGAAVREEFARVLQEAMG